MRNADKFTVQPTKPSPNPSTVVDLPAQHASDAVQGEGSYSGTRDYQKGVKSYLEDADVENDARKAAPQSAEEASELEAAEQAGRQGGKKSKASTKPK